eukprot:363067-Chlamydomonas_euryale.AAC.3
MSDIGYIPSGMGHVGHRVYSERVGSCRTQGIPQVGWVVSDIGYTPSGMGHVGHRVHPEWDGSCRTALRSDQLFKIALTAGQPFQAGHHTAGMAREVTYGERAISDTSLRSVTVVVRLRVHLNRGVTP